MTQHRSETMLAELKVALELVYTDTTYVQASKYMTVITYVVLNSFH